MQATRGVKRTASKDSASTASTAPSKKKRFKLEIPTAPQKRGCVYTCGQGDVGQLGLGENVIKSTKFKHVAALGDEIVTVSAGGMHTIAIDSSGKVWTYGCNDEGALGRPTTSDQDEGTPKEVSLPSKAVAISAGDSHSAALLENGHVYAWGSFRDSHGSMGLVVHGREGKVCRAPVRVELGERAVGLASGADHLVMLTTSGTVYTIGCGEQGQLGRLAQRSSSRKARKGISALLTPLKVHLRGRTSRVWAGYHGTFLLDAAMDRVFAFGLNNYGQLGITGEKFKTALYDPVECDAFSGRGEWGAVALGQHHSIALDAYGKVYSIGRCDYGRLGLGEGTGDAEILEPVPKLQWKKCISIAAGTNNSFAVTDTGEVWAWGMGSEGQLGTGNHYDAVDSVRAWCGSTRMRLPAAVGTGGQHSVLLMQEDPNANRDPGLKLGRKIKSLSEKAKGKTGVVEEEEESTNPQTLNGEENKDAVEEDKTDRAAVSVVRVAAVLVCVRALLQRGAQRAPLPPHTAPAPCYTHVAARPPSAPPPRDRSDRASAGGGLQTAPRKHDALPLKSRRSVLIFALMFDKDRNPANRTGRRLKLDERPRREETADEVPCTVTLTCSSSGGMAPLINNFDILFTVQTSLIFNILFRFKLFIIVVFAGFPYPPREIII